MTTKTPEVYTSYYLMKRLISQYVLPHKGKLILAIICMILVAATTAAHAWMMQPALDEIFVRQNKSMLMYIPIAIILIAVLKGWAAYGQNVMIRYIGQRIITDMQLTLYAHLLRADLSYLHAQTSGRLISRLSNDIGIMRQSVSTVFTSVAREALTFIFLIGLMFYQSVELALIAFVVFPLGVYPIVRLGKRMRKVSTNTQSKLADFTSQLDETFQGIRVIRSYGREDYEIGRASTVIEHIFNLYMKAARTESASSPIMELLTGTAIAAIIWHGGSQVIAGTTTPGAFFSFISAMLMAYRPMKNLSSMNTQLQEGLAAAKRFFTLIDTKPTIVEKPNAKALHVSTGTLHFHNVNFSYNAEKQALKNLSLTVPGGKTVALVGPSGGGKSTIINLLLRFYDIESGRITIDDMDIRDISFTSLRQSMALVSQDITLFDDTVRANIAYGHPDATEDAVIEAAYNAAAHDFIMELPQGYDTIIGQHGMKLSGGQRQRLAIARAMLRNAPILLLDEATSALDPISEQQIQAALERLMKGRTTLVIAHRLSTIMNADVIYVLRQGSIVEVGTHNELISLQGEYNKLYTQHFRSNETA